MIDNSYFKTHSKIIAEDLSKQQELDADPKAKQQINFTGNLSSNDNNRLIFFIIEEGKETIFVFSQGTVKVLWTFFFVDNISRKWLIITLQM